MQLGLVIFSLLFPSDQEPAQSIHPAMRPFYDPTVGFDVRIFTSIRFLFTGLDMRLVTSALQICFQPACFVAFVQADFFPRTPRLKGIQRIDVMRVSERYDQRQRKPAGIRHQAALYALFLSVRGVAACFFAPDSGDLGMQPSIDSHDQSMSSRCLQSSNPFCQKRSKTPALHHSWKRRCAELDEYIPVAFRGAHWNPVLSTKNVAFIAARLSTRLR